MVNERVAYRSRIAELRRVFHPFSFRVVRKLRVLGAFQDLGWEHLYFMGRVRATGGYIWGLGPLVGSKRKTITRLGEGVIEEANGE